MSSALRKLRPITPGDVEGLEAARLVGANGEVTEVPASIYKLIQDILPALKEGQAMLLVPTQRRLTSQEAADILGISRTYLKKLMDRGEVPFQRIGTHRRVAFGDLMAYQERREAERRQQIDEVLASSVEMGAYTKAGARDLRTQK